MVRTNGARNNPYVTPVRKSRHYRLKRNQILRALGSSSYINGSSFAILWITPTGESEMFGSKALSTRIGNWFSSTVLDEARICLDRDWKEREVEAKQGRTLTNPADVYSSKGEVFSVEPDGNDGLEEEPEDEEEVVGGAYTNLILQQSIYQQQQQQQQQSQQASSHHHSGTYSGPSSAISTPVLQHAIPFPSTSTYVPPPTIDEPSSGESSSRITRSISSTTLNSTLAPKISSSSSSSTLRSVTFTPTSLESWYSDKLSSLQSKASKVVCKLWIKAIEPNKSTTFPYGSGTQAGSTSPPPWWPDNLRHRDPDHLSKSERVILGCFLLRSSEFPLDSLEEATAKPQLLLTADKLAVLSDLYNVASEERKLLLANNSTSFEYLFVTLPIPATSFTLSNPLSILPASATYISPPVISEPSLSSSLRAAPYPLSRSHSSNEVSSPSGGGGGAGPGSRALSRSHSHSGYSTSIAPGGGSGAAGRDTMRRSRKPRSSLGGSTSGGGGPVSPFRQSSRGLSTSPQPFQNHTQSFGDAGESLLAPIALESSQSHSPGGRNSRSNEGTPYQQSNRSPSSASSYRMQASPSEGVNKRSRSQNQESSFASPGMIKARSVIGNMRTIPEAIFQPSFTAKSNSINNRADTAGIPIPIPLHPAHAYDPTPYVTDYPTPSYLNQSQSQQQSTLPLQPIYDPNLLHSPNLVHSSVPSPSTLHPSLLFPSQQSLGESISAISPSHQQQHLQSQSHLSQHSQLQTDPFQQQQSFDSNLNQSRHSPSLHHPTINEQHPQQLPDLQQSHYEHTQPQLLAPQEPHAQQYQSSLPLQNNQLTSSQQNYIDQVYYYPTAIDENLELNATDSVHHHQQQSVHPHHQQHQHQQQNDQIMLSNYLQQHHQPLQQSNDYDSSNFQHHSNLDLGSSLNLNLMNNSGRKPPPMGMEFDSQEDMILMGEAYTAEKRRGEQERRYEGLVYGMGDGGME